MSINKQAGQSTINAAVSAIRNVLDLSMGLSVEGTTSSKEVTNGLHNLKEQSKALLSSSVAVHRQAQNEIRNITPWDNGPLLAALSDGIYTASAFLEMGNINDTFAKELSAVAAYMQNTQHNVVGVEYIAEVKAMISEENKRRKEYPFFVDVLDCLEAMAV